MREPRDVPAASPFLIGLDAAVRVARDRENMPAVYTRVFGSTDGKAVLIDMMSRSCLFIPRPGSMSLSERSQLDGLGQQVLETLSLAGLDAFAIGGGVLALASAEHNLTPDMERAHGDADERSGTGDGRDTLGNATFDE